METDTCIALFTRVHFFVFDWTSDWNLPSKIATFCFIIFHTYPCKPIVWASCMTRIANKLKWNCECAGPPNGIVAFCICFHIWLNGTGCIPLDIKTSNMERISSQCQCDVEVSLILLLAVCHFWNKNTRFFSWSLLVSITISHNGTSYIEHLSSIKAHARWNDCQFSEMNVPKVCATDVLHMQFYAWQMQLLWMPVPSVCNAKKSMPLVSIMLKIVRKSSLCCGPDKANKQSCSKIVTSHDCKCSSCLQTKNMYTNHWKQLI